jgi:hypothetical protein
MSPHAHLLQAARLAGLATLIGLTACSSRPVVVNPPAPPVTSPPPATQPPPVATPVPAANGQVLKVRYVNNTNQLFLSLQDQAVVVSTNGRLELPDLNSAEGRRFADGQLIVIRAAQGVAELTVTGAERNQALRLRGGESLTVMAAKGTEPPQWLVIR